MSIIKSWIIDALYYHVNIWINIKIHAQEQTLFVVKMCNIEEVLQGKFAFLLGQNDIPMFTKSSALINF